MRVVGQQVAKNERLNPIFEYYSISAEVFVSSTYMVPAQDWQLTYCHIK